MTTIQPHSLTGHMGSGFTTYRIGGPLDEIYKPNSFEEACANLQEIRSRIQLEHHVLTILGWGGNTIIASAGIRGITLITRKMDWVENLGNNRFQFGAGVHLAKSAKVAQDTSLTGGEYMIGIPGTIGGAIRMNAGALKQETAEIVREATIFNMETGGIETWDHERLGFHYRKSAIQPDQHIVLQAVLEFTSGDPTDIAQRMDGSVQFRKTHHPTEPNGGSVFKNPDVSEFKDPESKMSAGQLLDKLGARTWEEGGVRVCPIHANFIINDRQGTSTDILRLMTRMKRAAFDAYGVCLHPENLFIGDATEEEKDLWAELKGV
ncbi:MAG: UDP-N-acetylmuramate dehydrogenase [Vampirovibrio sp.]|nr:UDP-N-acetylmuramate dehydrogenase [Vampirovibrio sp.]